LLNSTQKHYTPDDEDSESYQYNTKKVFIPIHLRRKINHLTRVPTYAKGTYQLTNAHLRLLKYQYTQKTKNSSKWEKDNGNTSKPHFHCENSTRRHLWLEINTYTWRSVSLSAARGTAVILVLSTVFLWEELKNFISVWQRD